jgi:hypothetical protein
LLGIGNLLSFAKNTSRNEPAGAKEGLKFLNQLSFSQLFVGFVIIIITKRYTLNSEKNMDTSCTVVETCFLQEVLPSDLQ